MDQDAIVNFVDEKGIGRRKPSLKEIITEAQIEQIRHARREGVTWAAIVRYFKEEHDMDYGVTAYRSLVEA